MNHPTRNKSVCRPFSASRLFDARFAESPVVATAPLRRPQALAQSIAAFLIGIAFWLPAVAPAASITWGAATSISGDSEVSTGGALVGAFNVGAADAGSPTVNGVTFTEFVLNAGSTGGAQGNFSLSSGAIVGASNAAGSGSAPFTGLSASYQALLQSEGGAVPVATPFTLTMSGLSVGQTYQFEWWANISSSSFANDLTTATAGNTVTLDSNKTNAVGGIGQFAIGTFVADSTSQAIVFNSAGEAIINAFELRVAPPPSAFWTGDQDGTWTTSNAGNTNWATAAAGTIDAGLIPGAPINVTFSAAGAVNQNTTLGANFTIHRLTVSDPNPVTISSGAGGPFTLTIAGDAGTGITVNSGSNLTINSNLTLGGASDTITVDGTGVATIAGVLGGNNGLIKAGAGLLTLSNSGNNYTGATQIQDGTLKLGADNAVPAGSASTVNAPTGTGNAVLDLNGHRLTVSGLTLVAEIGLGQSTVDVNGGVLTLAGDVNVIDSVFKPGNNFAPIIQDGIGGGAVDLGNATRTFNIAGQNVQVRDLIVNAVIQGNGGIVVNAAPSTFNGTEGGIVLEAVNTYTGSTTVAQGRLTALTSGALPATTDLILGTANSALAGDVDIFGTAQTVNSISVAAGNAGGASNIIESTFGGAIFTVSSTTTNSTFGGLITGDLELDKEGVGTTLTVTGANTYGNGTVLKNGTLRTQNISALGAGSVQIQGGRLQVKGPLNVDSLLWSGGRISLEPAAGDVINSASSFVNAGSGGAFEIDPTGLQRTTYTLVNFVNPTNFVVSDFSAFALNSNFLVQGTFLLNPTNVQFTVTGVTMTGPLLQNSAPVGVPTFADFIVNGPVTTGGPTESNTVNTLTFFPDSSLKIFNTLHVTTGPVNLVGNSSIDLENATLDVNQLNVLPKGFLGGNGNILGNLFNAGIVSPGHSPGHIHVTGNYTQTAAGLLKIEIGGRDLNQHDLLSVDGTAKLDGALQLVRVNHFKLKRNKPVTFLTANEGVNGRFATVENDFTSDTILEPTVVYRKNSVALEAVQGSFETFAQNSGLTSNQRSVAKALDNVVNARRANSLIDYLDYRKLTGLPGDFDKIAPEELTSIFTIGTSLAGVQSQNIQRRNDDIRSGSSGSSGFSAAGLAVNGAGPSYSGTFGSAGPLGSFNPTGPSDDEKDVADQKDSRDVVAPAGNRWGAFLSGTGEWVSVGNTDNARGYDLSSGGFTLGMDYKVTSTFAIGLAAGYTGTSADLADRGRVWVNGGKIGIYATFFPNEQTTAAPMMSKDSSPEAPAPTPSPARGFYADLAAFGGYNSYDTRRNALQGEARGDTAGGELNALFGAGYDFNKGGLTFGPAASFNYTYIGTNEFTEHGSLAPLNIHGGKGESLRTALGFKASYDWKVGGVLIKPELRAAWQHEYGDSAYALNSSFGGGTGNSFLVNGPQLGRDSALLGAGFAIQFNDRMSTYFYYDGEVGRKNYQSTSITGGFRVAF
ncbi:autotransporter outer membrane beta-barrel domain-containing protein [Chthoniobacter flavus]|uniref:autotransporter outer membrane beta-barrel domain-containing protein n=1 Tax=Chthoniobacter flavus TaxID=191863 RepID=UPI00104AB0FD|nr:autotransporter outer membrane beta-barrel domain-containing protein [Chthoniobacter flavus]